MIKSRGGECSTMFQIGQGFSRIRLLIACIRHVRFEHGVLPKGDTMNRLIFNTNLYIDTLSKQNTEL